MILCLVCLAFAGMLLVAGCTSTPSGNATPTKAPNGTPAPTMNNSILKVNNNQAPNLSATTAAPTVNATAGNATTPIVNITLPVNATTNVSVPK
jgi:PBP1b-binding outer membrane lipoprotein LpoB